ncbi:MAG: ribbon-helix-helix protein, CopG family [Methylococcaceae bacterium]|nr:MAG: ribbon-helix-helix protein, CopG family [Methylococcaceae bacterium]
MSTLTIRIADDIKQQLDVLADATGQSKSFLIVEAIRGRVKQEAWQVAEIRQAIQEADVGDFAAENEVLQVRSRWLGNEG